MGKIYFRSMLVMVLSSSLLIWGWLKLGGNEILYPKSRHHSLDRMEKNGAFDFKLSNLSGQEVSLSSFKGKIIILNFWASWCDPCAEEFPSMVKLINDFSGEVVMLAVSNDSDEKEMREFLKVFGKEVNSSHLTVLWDKDMTVAKKYEVNKLPETFILDKDLKLVRKVIGLANWYNQDTKAFFKILVSEK